MSDPRCGECEEFDHCVWMLGVHAGCLCIFSQSKFRPRIEPRGHDEMRARLEMAASSGDLGPWQVGQSFPGGWVFVFCPDALDSSNDAVELCVRLDETKWQTTIVSDDGATMQRVVTSGIALRVEALRALAGTLGVRLEDNAMLCSVHDPAPRALRRGLDAVMRMYLTVDAHCCLRALELAAERWGEVVT